GRRLHTGGQERPVRHGVAYVAHVLRLGERRGDRTRVEVISADADRRFERAFCDEVIGPLAKRGALAIAEPADPRRESLEGHPISCKPDPPRERAVLREELEPEVVGAMDVRGIAGEGDPAERASSL